MEVIKAAVLAIVQALTEFLPVSSSGHLAIADALFKEGTTSLQSYIIITHFGTMLATLIVFIKEIWAMVLSLGTIPTAIKEKKAGPDLKMIGLIIVASIPTGVMGVLLADHFEAFTSNLVLVGIMLIITGGILLVTKYLPQGARTEKDFKWWRALILGTAQGFAIMPGISRSGTTISTSLMLGADRKFAGRISFLISLPAIAAAGILDLVKEYKSVGISGDLLPLGLAFVVSFGVGWLALKLLLKLIQGGKFHYFSLYCFLLGAATIVLRLTGVI